MVKRRIGIVVAILVVLLFSSCALITKIPSLVGTWTGEMIPENGAVVAQQNDEAIPIGFYITDQANGTFSGFFSFYFDPILPDDTMSEAFEPLLKGKGFDFEGVVDAEGKVTMSVYGLFLVIEEDEIYIDITFEGTVEGNKMEGDFEWYAAEDGETVGDPLTGTWSVTKE